jgi:hypothetical protein
MKTVLKIFIFLPALMLQQVLMGQTEASVTLDTNYMLVGDQINLKLTFASPAGTKIKWPVLNDTIIDKIEILQKSKVDTVSTDDKSKMYLQQIFKITCFDSGFYAIPPILFTYKTPGNAQDRTEETQAVLLTVSSMRVNTAEDIRDIKNPMEAPFTLREAMPWIIALILLAGAGYGLFYYLKKKKKAEPLFRTPMRMKLPAHQIALDALENLRQKKLWQSGRIKDYHTELTDIIRDYILAKFNIHAPELTSDEIITALNYTAADAESRKKLGQTFGLADMVKFAKMQPLPAEHDSSLINAVEFVKSTMFQGGSGESEQRDVNTGSDKKQFEDADILASDLNLPEKDYNRQGKEADNV